MIAGMYGVYHGPEGVKKIAARVHALTGVLAQILAIKGLKLTAGSFFDTLTIQVKGEAAAVVERALALGINLRLVDQDHVAVSLDETCDKATVLRVASCFHGDTDGLEKLTPPAPRLGGLERTSAYLTHPVFSSHRSETEMLRYLRKLQAKDIALDRAMIPLGSCTMKLNATTEMIPVTMPGFGSLHPFVPQDQAQGYAGCSPAWRPGSPRSLALPPSRSSPMPAARANTQDCWRSALIMPAGAIRAGRSA